MTRVLLPRKSPQKALFALLEQRRNFTDANKHSAEMILSAVDGLFLQTRWEKMNET